MTPRVRAFAKTLAMPRSHVERRLRRPAVRLGARGWTLVELLLGLAIAALLAVFALPFYGDWIADYQVLNHAQLLAGTMNIARAEAIKHGRRVNLCKSCRPDAVHRIRRLGSRLRGSRRLGSRRRRRAGAAALPRRGPAASGITIRGNRPVDDYVSYTSLGTARLLEWRAADGERLRCAERAAGDRRRAGEQRAGAHPEDRGGLPVSFRRRNVALPGIVIGA
jgi:prepilin-type N-terminal cleavage/methylation domain-containing protein